MPLTLPDPPQSGNSVSAGAFGQVINSIKRCYLSVATNSGLSLRETPNGTTLGFSLPPFCYHAKVTQSIGLMKFPTLGHGKAIVYTESYDQNQVGTLKPLPGEFDVYFAAPAGGQTTAIPAGQYIVVARTESGRYSVVTGYC